MLEAVFSVMAWSSNQLMHKVLGYTLSIRPHLDGQGMRDAVLSESMGIASLVAVQTAISTDLSRVLVPSISTVRFAAHERRRTGAGYSSGQPIDPLRASSLLTNEELAEAAAVGRVVAQAAVAAA